MPSKPACNRKRMSTKIPQTASNTDDQNSKASKARKVNTNASVATAASLPVDMLVMTEKVNAACTASAAAKQEDYIIGQMIEDLSHFATVNDALDALNLDFMNDKKKRDKLVTAGGCFVLVHLMMNCHSGA